MDNEILDNTMQENIKCNENDNLRNTLEKSNENSEEFDIRINFKEESYTFEKKTYLPSLLSGLITENDYNNIVTQCGKLIGKSLLEKKENDTLNYPRVLIIGMILCLCLLIVFFATLSPSLTDHENNHALYVISIIIVVVLIVLAISLSIYNYNYDIRSFKNLSTFIVKHINDYLETVNEEYKNKLKFKLHDTGSEINRYLYVIVYDKK